jgi:ABC-type glutathione transport system ATPase component
MVNDLPRSAPQEEALLRVQGLSKKYARGGLWHKRVCVAAVADVGFEIHRGQTLALVGTSGSGKSTVARCVTGLEKPDSGRIWIAGTEIVQLDARALRPVRAIVQMIFQDAVTSINPRFSAAEVVEEPLLIQGMPRAERQAVAERMMKEVALAPEWLCRPVTEFSGGQRQRLAIARALTLRPKLLVLDEAFAGLDLSTQAQIANLLLSLQASYGLTLLLISHDLTLVARMADTLAVMSAGRIVESGKSRQILEDPVHETTRKLVASSQAAEFRFAASASS